MRIYAAIVYVFLYAPIGMLMLFSFSSGRQASTFEGFSTQWYGKAADNRFLIEAASNSLSIAALSAILGVLGGLIPIMWVRIRRRRRREAFNRQLPDALQAISGSLRASKPRSWPPP